MNVFTEPDRVATAIREYLWNNDSMLRGSYKEYLQHPLGGHCYISSECYYHTLPNPDAWTPQCLNVAWNSGGSHKEMTHWYLQHDNGAIVDLTADQFEAAPVRPDYSEGTGKGFLTAQPSNRCEHILSHLRTEFNKEQLSATPVSEPTSCISN
jgi:hypothetical protein